VIPLHEQALIRDRFATTLVSPVRIDFFTQKQTGIHIPGREECRACDDARVLFEELNSVAGGRISLTVYDLYGDRAAAERDHVDKIPAAAIRGLGKRVRHYGLPAGASFPGLVTGIGLLAAGESGLQKATVRRLQHLPAPVHVEVLVGKADQYSSLAAGLAFELAVASEQLRVDIVELDEFPRIAQSYAVRAVPVFVLNERMFCVGLRDETDLTAHIEEAAAGRIIQPPPGPSAPYSIPGPESGQAAARRLPSGIILP
jgi:glutaredoxin-like protein